MNNKMGSRAKINFSVTRFFAEIICQRLELIRSDKTVKFTERQNDLVLCQQLPVSDLFSLLIIS